MSSGNAEDVSQLDINTLMQFEHVQMAKSKSIKTSFQWTEKLFSEQILKIVSGTFRSNLSSLLRPQIKLLVSQGRFKESQVDWH